MFSEIQKAIFVRLTYHDERSPNNDEFLNEIKEVQIKAVYFLSTKDRAAEGRIFWVTLKPLSSVINNVLN